MKFLSWMGGLLLFVLALGFAVKNSDPVTVSYYLGLRWQTPLVLVVLIAFISGAVLGVVATLAGNVRQRREILLLKRELRGRAPSAPADTDD